MKKGFTIIELLTTIAIIGIISTTVVFAYQQITDRNYQTIYEAKVKEIETGALKYADANLDEIKNKTALSVSIEELIEMGYLEGDSEDKFHILDPRRNKDYINGYVLIYFEGQSVRVEFNAESITVKLTQDRSGLTSTQIKLKADIEVPEKLTMDYCVYELNDLKGYYSSFTSGKLKGNACNSYTFNNINYFIDVISGKPVLTHTATIKIYDNFGRETKQSITARVKEEKVDENIEVDLYYATNYPATKTKYDNKWTNQNVILVPNNKNKISYEYSLDLSTWNPLPSSGYVQSEPGDEYPVYIRKITDGVIGKSIGLIKTKIDKTNPTCTNSGDSTSWTNENRVINKSCDDTLSGCATNTQTQTFSITTLTATIQAYTIKDVAGNETVCPARTANIYVDKTPPVCSTLGESTTWTSGNRTIVKSCADNLSGCASGDTTQTFTTTAQTATLASYTISDRAGNKTVCPAKSVNVYVDKGEPTCSWSGASSSWAYSRTVSVTCGSTASGCDQTASSNSWSYSTTTQTANLAYVIKNKAGTTATCTYNNAPIYVDRTAPTCSSSGDSTTWTSGNRTIYKNCNDAHSGCSTSNTSQTFSTTTSTATIAAYTITDKVGNSRTCPARTASVYVDKVAPTCTNSGDSTSWTNENRVINKSCDDTLSGCATNTQTQTFSITTLTATIQAYTIKDVAGNETVCPARTANIYVDKTAPTCTSSGDSTTWTSGNRTIYKGCSDSHSGCTTGTTSHTFSSNAKTGTIPAYTVTDKAGNSRSCPARTANVYVDKTAPTLWYAGTCPLSTVATVCHRFNFSDNSNDTIYLYRSYCCNNHNMPNGNSNYCNTSNLTAKTRVERYKDGIDNPPDNKSAITTHNYGNHTFNYATSFIKSLPMHYGFIVCDKAGNCSGTYTYFCSSSSC